MGSVPKSTVLLLDCPKPVYEELRDLYGFHGGYSMDRVTGEDIGLRTLLQLHTERNDLIKAIRTWLPMILYEIAELENAVCTVWFPEWSEWHIELFKTATFPKQTCRMLKADTTTSALTQFTDFGIIPKYYAIPTSIAIQRIEVPEPHGYNGALLKIDRGYWLVYRANPNCLARALLNQDLSIVEGSHTPLSIPHSVDGRLLCCKRGLFLSTVWGPEGDDCIELRRIDSIALEGNSFDIVEDIGIFKHIENFPGYQKVPEKNWTPWEWNDELLLTYGAQPHRILRLRPDNKVELAYTSSWNDLHVSRNFGRFLRLNTPPVRISDDFYLSTFHTSTRAGYFTWFYTFEARPPFRVSGVSPLPVITPRHASGTNFRTGSQCIFILSMLVDRAQDRIMLCGGDNDSSVVVVSLSLWEVLQDLITVTGPHS